jgi:hypothetical protein
MTNKTTSWVRPKNPWNNSKPGSIGFERGIGWDEGALAVEKAMANWGKRRVRELVPKLSPKDVDMIRDAFVLDEKKTDDGVE